MTQIHFSLSLFLRAEIKPHSLTLSHNCQKSLFPLQSLRILLIKAASIVSSIHQALTRQGGYKEQDKYGLFRH